MNRQNAQEQGAGTGVGDKTDCLANLTSSGFKRLGLGVHRSLAGIRGDMLQQVWWPGMPGNQLEK